MSSKAGETGPAEAIWYSYAVFRVVPRVEREEFLNVGVILFARTANFLRLQLELDERRLLALAPDIDLGAVRKHLKALQEICEGSSEGGLIASLSQSERFHWLTAPRSTVIQPSPIHVGRCESPEVALQELMNSLVRWPGPAESG